MSKILIVGPFPPPVYGMSKNLKEVADILERRSDVTRINISTSQLDRGLRYHFTKILRVLIGINKLIFIGLTSKNVRLYMPPDAGYGIYYSLLFAFCARLIRAKIILHHRSFAYINEYRQGMALLCRISGKTALHVFLCPDMDKQFRKHYLTKFRSIIVSNSQHVETIQVDQIKPLGSTLILGHMSNLGFDKGLKDVVQLTKQLLDEGLNVKLILAGPTENNEAKAFLDTAIVTLGEAMEYRGFVDKVKKIQFYADIDIFLFPTRYLHEAQPNVIFEANAAGVPVLTLDRGCIKSDVTGDNGISLDPSIDFTTQAKAVIYNWLSKPNYIFKLKISSLAKIQSAQKQAEKSYQQLIEEITN